MSKKIGITSLPFNADIALAISKHDMKLPHPIITATQNNKNSEEIKIGSIPLDKMMKGGLHPDEMTTFYGKTSLHHVDFNSTLDRMQLTLKNMEMDAITTLLTENNELIVEILYTAMINMKESGSTILGSLHAAQKEWLKWK